MQVQPSHYKDVLRGLTRELHSLDLKMGVLAALRDHQSEAYIQAAPVILGLLADSLMKDILLTVAKLYERKSDRSVHKLLGIAEQMYGAVACKSALHREALQRHRGTVEHHERTLDIIVARRNKSIAHYDKEYFDSPHLVEEDFALSAEEIEAVYVATQQILSDHCRALGEPMLVSVAEFSYASTQNMLFVLAQALELKGQQERLGGKLNIDRSCPGQ